MGKIIDITGEKYNRLKVIKQIRIIKNRGMLWQCECDCGNVIEAIGSDIRNGHTKSCGCLHIDTITTHGLRYTKLSGVYKAMLARCINENHKSYKNYGGRGISVNEIWIGEHGLKNFYDWSMSNGYQEGLTIDRKDVNGNYEPSNCRWADMKIQQNNKRNNHLLTIGGVTKTASQWSQESNISVNAILYRVEVGKSELDLIAHSAKENTISGVKGVTWSADTNKWQVRFQENRNRVNLGLYENLDDAIKVRKDYEIQRQFEDANK